MKLGFQIKNKKRKRVGRGISSGRGKTAGRGTKGQKSRTGFRNKRGFEGGQNPLVLRLPKKRGFKNFRKESYLAVNLADLNNFKDGETVNEIKLKEGGIISRIGPVKILGRGELKKKLTVEASSFSKKAEGAIKKAGGEAKKI